MLASVFQKDKLEINRNKIWRPLENQPYKKTLDEILGEMEDNQP